MTREAMRAIWKGAVSFGLVSVPVKLYAATESHDVVPPGAPHRRRPDPVQAGLRVLRRGGAYADIAKGYESEDGELVILTDDGPAELPLPSSREIDVAGVRADRPDRPDATDEELLPRAGEAAAKPYALLREALREADRMALVKVAIRQRESLAVLRVRDDVIVLQTHAVARRGAQP